MGVLPCAGMCGKRGAGEELSYLVHTRMVKRQLQATPRDQPQFTFILLNCHGVTVVVVVRRVVREGQDDKHCSH